MKFNELGFQPQLQEGLDMMGFEEPTPIQQQAIPAILANKDLIACAQTALLGHSEWQASWASATVSDSKLEHRKVFFGALPKNASSVTEKPPEKMYTDL